MVSYLIDAVLSMWHTSVFVFVQTYRVVSNDATVASTCSLYIITII